MRTFHQALLFRRAALVERSATQRAQLAESTERLRREAATPLLVGAGLAATLLSSSPQLRTWAVRGWAAYTLLRRVIDR